MNATPSRLIKNPTWPTGPDICEYEFLPAFPTEGDARAWHGKLGDSPTPMKYVWQCSQCGQWHYISTTFDAAIPRYIKDDPKLLNAEIKKREKHDAPKTR